MTKTSIQTKIGVNATTSLDRKFFTKRNILQAGIEKIAIEKFRSSGYGLTCTDVQREYSVEKKHAQRSLKHLHGREVLFTSRDLLCQGIHLLKNKNPQQYYPTCIKGEIIEKLKKRNSVRDDLKFQPPSTSFRFRESNLIIEKKAQTLLDTLLLVPYTPIYIHKLQLIFCSNENFNASTKVIVRIRKTNTYEEIIGRRHVSYILSLNGTVQVFVRSNDAPFRLESELDESLIFSFFGQVKDRLLYIIGDVKELVVPSIMEWILLQCDVNKDIEIDEKAQLVLPDIQLKYASRVFREYVKVMQGKAYYRIEESLKLKETLSIALKHIRQPFTSHEKRIEDLERKYDNQLLIITEFRNILQSLIERSDKNKGASRNVQ